MRHNQNKPNNVSHDLGYVPSPSFAHATSSKELLKIPKSGLKPSFGKSQVLLTNNAKTQAKSTRTHSESSEIGSVWMQTAISKEPKSPDQSPCHLKSLGKPQSPNKPSLNTKSSGKSKALLKGHIQLPNANLASAKAPSIGQLPISCSNYVASSRREISPIRSPPKETRTGKSQNTLATPNNNSMTLGKTKSPLNEETIAKIFEESFGLKDSSKPVVPQPNTVMDPVPDESPTFCGGGQCANCVSLISHLTYTPAYNMNPLSVLCKLINSKTKKSLIVRALFDNCSNVTVLRRSIADKLELGLKNVDVSFTGTGGSCSLFKDQVEVEFVLQSLVGTYTSPLIQAVTLPTVSHTFRRPVLNPCKFPHLREINDYTEDYTAPPTHKVVDLLIGQPFEPHLGQVRKVLGPTIGTPTAITTQLGTCLSVSLPKLSSVDKGSQVSHSTEASPEDRTLLLEEDSNSVLNLNFADRADDLMLEWMSLDRIALHPRDYPDCDNDLSNEEYQAREKVLAGTYYDETRKQYVTSLPLKDNPIMSTNRDRAYTLSIAWKRKLAVKDPEFLQQWMQAYQDGKDWGFFTLVPPEDLKKTSGYHYISTF